jgi:hypothetical protein
VPRRLVVLPGLRGGVVTDQLAFDFGAQDDLIASVRALVAEPGMTDAEIEAVVEDALSGLGWRLPTDAARAKACECVHRLVLPFDRGDGPRCLWCGRAPS